MQVEHHDLHHEFPDMVEKIQLLRAQDLSFSSLCDEYNRLTGDVERLEEADIPVDDFTIEDMKKKRVKLKDDLYQMLLSYGAT